VRILLFAGSHPDCPAESEEVLTASVSRVKNIFQENEKLSA